MRRKALLIILTFILGLPWMAVAQTRYSGEGTSANPYKITSAADWHQLAIDVSYGNTYNGVYFQQTANITTSSAIGCANTSGPTASFAGTYDGNGKTLTANINDSGGPNAPFRAVDGATIKNLIVAGTMTAASWSENHSAGLVGFVGNGNGTTTIENCWVTASVGSGVGNYIGGIVGHAINAAVTMKGCVFTGTLNAGAAEGRVGGLIGWSNGEWGDNSAIANRITVTNCFFYGTTTNTNTYFHPVIFGNRHPEYVQISNTYHNKGESNPTQLYSGYKVAYTITAGSYVTVACSGSSTSYGVSKITAYAHGIVYDGRIYAGNGDSVGLTLGYSHSGYQITSYSATNGTLSGSGSSYTLAKGTGNTVISANEARLYTVSTSTPGNGTVSVSASSAIAGTTITITPHPNTGYSVASVTTSPSCTVTNNGNGTYRFTMPSSNVTVTVTFYTKPTVTTGTVGTPTINSVSITGNNVSATGGANVTARGVYCSTSANPTSGGGASGSGTGTYTVNLSGLNSNTLYHVRAYATNTAGTGYGSDKTFTTLASVTTASASPSSGTAATLGGNVAAGGGASLSNRGVVYSVKATNSNPTIGGTGCTNVVISGTATGNFSQSVTGLTAGTTYCVRAYATNAGGTNYGSVVEFTMPTVPTVTTGTVGTPTTNSVSITTNNVSATGGASVTARGVYCSTSANPTSGGSASGSGTGNYDVSLSGLNSNTLYHVRAYATNMAGTGYGSDKTFTTLAVVSTPTSASVTSTSATFSSSVTAGGNATITERGVYWSTSSTAPTGTTTLNSSNSMAASTAATGSYSVTPTSFTTGTTYYVWAYVRNAGGINFSSSYHTITTLNSYTVTYDKNHSGASGTMTDSNSPYDAGSTVTVLANSFSAPTNYIFGTWNTAADGSGTSYTAGSQFTITANTTLYAQWAPNHIANATQWNEFCAVVNNGFTYSGQTVYLDANITVTTSAPVGTSSKPFQGTFEGNGHIVDYTHSANVDHKGLFGYVSGSGNIQNVIVNATLSGTSTSVGAVVGTFASLGTISNVEGAGTISSSSTHTGGLVGNMTSGTIHSSFAAATLSGSATNMGGLVGNNGGNIYNSYSNCTYSGSATYKGGLAGINSGAVENCYAAGIASGVSAFAGSGTGTIEYCYSNAVGDGYVGTNGTAPSSCGLYGTVQSNIKHLDYMYRDNLINKETNTYVGSNDAIEDGISVYVNNHIPVWNGLVSALNQWVRANPRGINVLAPWYRPLTTNINGDLPVLGFAKDNSLGTLDSDGKFLQYGSNQNGSNGLDAVLTAFNGNTASIFHYGKATGVTQVPTANVKVSVAEDAVLMQTTTSPSDFKATVGVTFDNSDRGAHAYDYWGNKLNYDWHLLSTPLSDLKTGAVHSSYEPSGNAYSEADITAIGGYFPDGLITGANPAVGGTIKWDFYTYYEPQYHWINLKRNKKNHYHQDYPGIIAYNEADQDLGDGTAKYIPGKGYEMAINQDTYMNAKGTLNKGSVEITLNELEPEGINYQPGANLVGNPYQGYLDLSQITGTYPELDKFYIYDADQGVFAPVVDGSSSNPVIPSKYVHPHQAFFVLAPSNDFTLTFQPTWAGTTTGADDNSHYRDEADEPHYPLVNLFADDGTGRRDLTVIEFHRPELGGAPKLDYMRTAPFILAAHHAGTNYGIFFATDDMERIPVRFQTSERCLITLTWSTYNGEFSKLLLIDNKLGVEHDMLTDNSYTFEASPEDYSSRFYIVYDCSGTGIEEEGYSTGTGSFAYIGTDGNIVIDMDVETCHGASLQVIDAMGRVLYSTVYGNGVHTVSTNGLAKGMYFLRLTNGDIVKTQKIVVK